MKQIGEGGTIATLLLYIQACNKMAALGYAFTLGKQTLRSPKCCTSQNATGTLFVEV